MPDVKKIAALSMMELTEEEAVRLAGDVAEILAMGQSMPAEAGETQPGRAVPTEALREDIAVPCGRGPRLIALSKKERDGFITVSRTVGGDV